MVIPSQKLVKSGPEKDDLFEDYKEALSEIPCRLFNKGQGLCPFRNSCLYAHLSPDGTLYEYPWETKVMNDYGEWEDDSDQTLAQRIGQF